MQYSVRNWAMAIGVALIGVAIGVGGVYVGEVDDAPGGSVAAILLMIGALVVAVRIARRKT